LCDIFLRTSFLACALDNMARLARRLAPLGRPRDSEHLHSSPPSTSTPNKLSPFHPSPNTLPFLTITPFDGDLTSSTRLPVRSRKISPPLIDRLFFFPFPIQYLNQYSRFATYSGRGPFANRPPRQFSHMRTASPPSATIFNRICSPRPSPSFPNRLKNIPISQFSPTSFCPTPHPKRLTFQFDE